MLYEEVSLAFNSQKLVFRRGGGINIMIKKNLFIKPVSEAFYTPFWRASVIYLSHFSPNQKII